jgi:hypothetical protein
LEIAVGISILAIVSGFIVRKSMIANRYMREQKTKSNIDTIVISIASFVANNQRLPRPSATNDGIESDSENLKFGYIPYKTLGISEPTARDGNQQPFVYMIEPQLSENFTKIYGNKFYSNVFCRNIHSPKISIQGYSSDNVIAFVIDTKNHKNIIEEKIKLRPTAHTFWITRDMLLMKYLKNSPCSSENPQQNTNQHLQEFDDDF